MYSFWARWDRVSNLADELAALNKDKTAALDAMQQAAKQRQEAETATEARQAEPGPSVLALLVASTGLAVLILGVVWFAFFRT